MAQETESCENCQAPKVESQVVEEDISSSDLDNGRTDLHDAVIRGDASRLKYLILPVGEKETLVKQADKDGNTVLHWAVKRNRVDIVKLLLQFHPGLCSLRNCEEETPLCMAVKLGCLDVVKVLINHRPDCIEIRSKYKKNVLHLAVEFRRVEIVKFLAEEADLPEVVLRQLINQSADEPRRAGEGTCKCKETMDNEPNLLENGGNTPLHIAANDKNLDMVELLLNVDGVDKSAFNKAGLTPLDIAREITEYHESFGVIEKLVDFRKRERPFLYNAPTLSRKKYKNALRVLEDAFTERRETELIVAVLLATIAFTAALQVPGSFNQTDEKTAESHKALGSPILIGYHSFKLFLIFDCVAFFLSLFVALLWTISSKLATDDLMLFMTISGTVLCIAFAFTAYAFMLGVYAVVGHKVPTLAKVILGCSIAIYVAGHLAYLHALVKVLIRRAKVHRLCGVPRWLDNKVEKIWTGAEKRGLLDISRSLHEKCRRLLTGHKKARKKDKSHADGKFRDRRVADCP